MPIISVKIMKTIDERKMLKTTTTTKEQTKTEKSKGTEAIVKGLGLNDFVVHSS